MKKGGLSSTFERDVCPIRQITPWEASGSHLRAAPKRMSVLRPMRTKPGSHLEKSLSARFPLIVDKNRRYVSRLTTRKKATRQAVCCELGFLIRADWEKLAGSHLDSHIGDICPRRRVLKEKAGTRPAFSLRPRTGSQYLTASSRRRRGVRRRCATARAESRRRCRTLGGSATRGTPDTTGLIRRSRSLR